MDRPAKTFRLEDAPEDARAPVQKMRDKLDKLPGTHRSLLYQNSSVLYSTTSPLLLDDSFPKRGMPDGKGPVRVRRVGEPTWWQHVPRHTEEHVRKAAIDSMQVSSHSRSEYLLEAANIIFKVLPGMSRRRAFSNDHTSCGMQLLSRRLLRRRDPDRPEVCRRPRWSPRLGLSAMSVQEEAIQRIVRRRQSHL